MMHLTQEFSRFLESTYSRSLIAEATSCCGEPKMKCLDEAEGSKKYSDSSARVECKLTRKLALKTLQNLCRCFIALDFIASEMVRF